MAVHPWWKNAVVYQVYPRSFMDSNGDGIGDINGIISRIDHIAGLGVDTVWLSPHFDSPNADNGYDVRDYRRVMAEFGTMEDFDRLLAALKERGIRLVIDLVVNHSSDEHAWFVESRSSLDNPKRDWYVWRDGKNGGPPNNYRSFFGGSAWEHDATTDQWYLHYFAVKQPDLNWEVDKVRREVHDLMRFWLDKGVAGFRMDVIPFISKQPGLPDLTPEQLRNQGRVWATGPRVHEFLQEMNREVLAPYDAVAIGEAAGVTIEDTPLFVDSRRRELSMIFQFDLVRIDRHGWKSRPWRLRQFKEMNARLDTACGEHGWGTSFLSNHDSPRIVSMFGNDSPEWRTLSAQTIATYILTQRATPFVYQGDEIGMTNFPFTSIDQFDDIEVKGLWKDFVLTGKTTEEELMTHLRLNSRDHARTPVQWSNAAHGGFTTGTPWLAVNPNHDTVNAEAVTSDPHSVYHWYRRLIEARRNNEVLVHGAFADVDPHHETVFAYMRTLADERMLVVMNWSTDPVEWRMPDGLAATGTLLDNAGDTHAGDVIRLRGWQSCILRVS
jgi:oligo-1,6-glucosidase